ncbi:MAG: hypothetical protein AAFQ04_05830 [Pseudomonadota bacterium]
MVAKMFSAVCVVFLFTLPAYSQAQDGTYVVKVPSRTPFVSTVTIRKGKVVDFTMERNEILKKAAAIGGKSIVVEAGFLGRCGNGSSGRMTIDVKGEDLIFRQWKGYCAEKNANFNVRDKIKMAKQ